MPHQQRVSPHELRPQIQKTYSCNCPAGFQLSVKYLFTPATNPLYAEPMRILLHSIFITVASLSAPQLAVAQEVSAKMLGGIYAPTAAGARVAFIASSRSVCSGTLVGKNLVLTAAHCVFGDPDPSNYTIFVDNSRYSASGVYHESGFDFERPLEEARPYDLGMIVLSTNAKKKAPVPILIGRRARARQNLFIAGYGLNERSVRRVRTYKQMFKIGEIRLSSTDDEVLFSNHRATRTSLCSGDSGGPALQHYGNYIAMVGVASTGTNSERDGKCVLAQGGESAHVDLQSSHSLQFLAGFDGVEYATWGNMQISKVVDEIKPQLMKAVRARSLSQRKKIVIQALQTLRRVRDGGTENRVSLIDPAITALQEAKSATSLATGQGAIKEAYRLIAEVAKLGVT